MPPVSRIRIFPKTLIRVRDFVSKRLFHVRSKQLMIFLKRTLIRIIVAIESDPELVSMLEGSPGARLDIQNLMTLWLMHQIEVKSPFEGYLKSLPKSSTCPLAVHYSGNFA